MPYTIKGSGYGFKVCDKMKCFSTKPLTKKMAEKQRIAIALSESKKTGKPINYYFG
jgi:hypothetical protein